MTKLTDNQHCAMTNLIESCLSNMGGEVLDDLEADPFVWVEVDDLIAAGWSPKEAQGTLASLLVSGLVYEYELGLYALTEDWGLLSDFHA